MKEIKRTTQKILVLFVIVNLIASSFYPVLVYAQDLEKPQVYTDDFGTAAPEDPLLSQTPGMADESDINKDFDALRPVIEDIKDQDEALQAYDDLAGKMAENTKLGSVSARVESEAEAEAKADRDLADILARGSATLREAPKVVVAGTGNFWDGAVQVAGNFVGGVLGAVRQVLQSQTEEQVREALQRIEGTKAEPAIPPGGVPEYCTATDFAETPETNPECYPQQRFEKAKEIGERAGFKVEGDPTNYGISLTGAPDLSAYTVLNQTPVSEEEKEAARKSAEALAKFAISLLPGGAFPELVEKSNELTAETFVAEAVCKQAGFVDSSYVRRLLAQTPKSGQKQRQEVLELGQQVNPQFRQQIEEARALTYEELLARAKAQDPSLESRLAEASGLSQEEAKARCGQETTALETKIKDLNTETAVMTSLEVAGALPVAEVGVVAVKKSAQVAKPLVRKVTDPIGNVAKGAWDATLGKIFGGAGKEIAQESVEKVGQQKVAEQAGKEILKPEAKILKETPSQKEAGSAMTADAALKNPDQPVYVGGSQGKDTKFLSFDTPGQAVSSPHVLLDIEDARPLSSYSTQVLQKAEELAKIVVERPAKEEELAVLAKWAKRGIPKEKVEGLVTDVDRIYSAYQQVFKGVDEYGFPQFDWEKWWKLREDPQFDKLLIYAGSAMFYYGPKRDGFSIGANTLFLSGKEDFRLQIIEAMLEHQRRYNKYIKPVFEEVGGVFDNYVDYATSQGFDRERYKHLEGLLDSSKFWIVPKEQLDEIGAFAVTHTNTGQISFAVEYLDRLKTITHECLHLSVCLTAGYGASSERVVIQLKDRLGSKFDTLVGSNMDNIGRNISEGLTEWLAQQADGVRLPNGKTIHIPEAHKTYPEEVDAVRNLMSAIKSNKPEYSDDFLKSMVMDAALTGDLGNLLSAVGVERFIEIFRLAGKRSKSNSDYSYLVSQGLNARNEFNATLPLLSSLAILVNDLGLVAPVYAADESKPSVTLLDAQSYKLRYKKLLLEEILAKEGKLNQREVMAVARIPLLQPTVHRIQNGYRFVTGGAGLVEESIEPNKYRVEIAPIPGLDIKIPGVVEVKAGQKTVIPVVIKEGSGKVEEKEYAQGTETDKGKETGKVTVVVFSDKNNNGKLDKNEDILPWAGLTVELKRVSSDRAISLSEGDNQITLPILPDKLLTASILLREIALQEGDAISVSTFENGAWKTYVAEGAKAYSFEDFPILPQKSYSIKSRKDFTFLLKGQEFIAPPEAGPLP